MASWAKPGARCVYIGTRNRNLKWGGVNRPVIGQVYTVREVLLTKRGTTAIWLQEISNPSVYVRDEARYLEWAFKASSFRPLVTQSDDVAKFTHLLNTTKQTESA